VQFRRWHRHIRAIIMSLRIGFLASFFLLLATSRADAQALVRVPAQGTLQQAIATVSDGGVIEIAAGTYNAPSGGFTILNAQKFFTIRAAPGATVVLNGAGTNILRFSNASLASGRPVTFERLTFSGGVSSAANVGGAVTVVEADATFVNCTFQNNAAQVTDGGGGAILAQASRLMILGSSFSGNNAKRYGGAIGAAGGSRVAIHDTQFVNNRVNLPNHFPDSLGGAIFLLDSDLRFTNSNFQNNQAGFSGGAIYSFGTWSTPLSTPKTDIIGSRSTFSDNRLQRDPTSPAPGALTGGAIQTEDHVTLRLFNTTFTGNVATQGGAVANYRSIVEIHDSSFGNNQAIGNAPGDGYGGALLVVSDDQNLSDSQNRRPGTLLLRDTLFHSASGGRGARYGGCVVVIGDTNRAYGLAAGIPQMGTIAENRAVLDIDGSAFSSCVAGEDAGGGFGGAIMTQLADVRISGTIFLLNQAQRGTNVNSGSGGALAMFDNSTANIQNATFSRSAATFTGGAIWLQGSHLDVSGSRFLENQMLSGAWGGAVVFAAPENLGAPRPAVNATGLLQNNVISGNTGGVAILDFDSASSPFNLVRYGSNSVFPNDAMFYSNPQAPGVQTVAQLNGLTLHGTAKAPTPNTGLGSAPLSGHLVVAPRSALTTPPGGLAVFALSGGSATLNGSNIATTAGFVTPILGTNTLTVGGSSFLDDKPLAATPATLLTASPADVVTGGTTTLSWATTSGTFLAELINSGVEPTPGSSGTFNVVGLPATRVYRSLLVAREGGAVAAARVDVADSLIFKDDFQTP
jgi:hypothetical protein